MNFVNKKRLAFIFGLVIIWSFIIWRMDFRIFSLETLKENAQLLHDYTQLHYKQVLIRYIYLFITATAAFIPVTILMTILGGFLFGALAGGIYAAFSASMGGSIVFLIVRYFMRDWVKDRYADRFEAFNHKFQQHGARYLLSLQISPITPTFFINLLVGLTNISLWTYMWTAFVGMLPGALIYALAGQKIQEISDMTDIMPPLLFVFLLIVSLLGIWPMSKQLKNLLLFQKKP